MHGWFLHLLTYVASHCDAIRRGSFSRIPVETGCTGSVCVSRTYLHCAELRHVASRLLLPASHACEPDSQVSYGRFNRRSRIDRIIRRMCRRVAERAVSLHAILRDHTGNLLPTL